RADIYFAGVICLVAGVILFFMEAILLIFANPILLIEQMRMIATYGIITKLIGITNDNWSRHYNLWNNCETFSKE
ncbi:MAG: hypothetical protein QXG34_04200, partial [Candidatus Bathyarchaeia archaeon]